MRHAQCAKYFYQGTELYRADPGWQEIEKKGIFTKKNMAQRNNNSGNDNTNNQPTSTSAFVQLIASLFELSKAANEASKAAVDFFNVVDAKPQYSAPPVFDPSLLAPQPQQQMTQQMQQQMQQLQQQMQQRQQDALVGSAGAAGAEPQQKKKKKRDPNAPKKPLTSFFLYSNFMRDVIIKERMENGTSRCRSRRLRRRRRSAGRRSRRRRNSDGRSCTRIRKKDTRQR